jgi:hypothetical protein
VPAASPQGDLEGPGAGGRHRFAADALMWLEEPQVTRARILVARGTDADLHLALQILEVLDKIAERTHNTRYKIAILALRALALDAVAQRAAGETSAANTDLKQAVDLARPEGFIRIFADLGNLRRRVPAGSKPFREHSLLCISQADKSGRSESPAQPARSIAPFPDVGEPLTPRARSPDLIARAVEH